MSVNRFTYRGGGRSSSRERGGFEERWPCKINFLGVCVCGLCGCGCEVGLTNPPQTKLKALPGTSIMHPLILRARDALMGVFVRACVVCGHS